MLRLRSMPDLTKIHFTNGEDIFVTEGADNIALATSQDLGFFLLTRHDGRKVRVNFAHVLSYSTQPEPAQPPEGTSFAT